MIDRDFVNKIEELVLQAAGKTVVLDNREFSTVEVHDPPSRFPKRIDPIKFGTLTGLAEFWNFEVLHASPDLADRIAGDGVAILVESPTRVHLITRVNHTEGVRDLLGVADASGACLTVPTIFSASPSSLRFMAQEAAILALMTEFEDTPTRAELVKFLGQLEAMSGAKSQDDGISQTVTARTAIVRREDVVARPLWLLQPRIGFPEIEHPEFEVLVRLKGEANATTPPTVTFLPINTGAVALEARRRIAAWFKEQPGIGSMGANVPVLI